MTAESPKPEFDVMWGIACYGAMHHATILTLCDMLDDYSRNSPEYGYRMIFMSNALICSARTRIVEEAIKTKSKYVLFLDADMTFPHCGARALVAHADKLGLDMLSGLYCMRRPPHYPLFYADMEAVGKHHRSVPVFPEKYKGMPIKIDAAGFGMCLIKTSVFEALPKPWFVLDPSISASEDIPFFASAKKHGFQLWADPNVVCGHLGDPQIIMPTKDAPCSNPYQANIIDAKEYCAREVGVEEYTPGEPKEKANVEREQSEAAVAAAAESATEAGRKDAPVRLEKADPPANAGRQSGNRSPGSLWHRSS